jgi:hypothetical protein
MQSTLDSLPASESEFVDQMMARVDTTKFVAEDYEIG